jgi:hypothetical protein
MRKMIRLPGRTRQAVDFEVFRLRDAAEWYLLAAEK